MNFSHTLTHTQFCLACSSTFSCLKQTGRKANQREKQVIYSSFWLCAFATLAYWIHGFSPFRGLVLFCFVCLFFWTFWFLLGLQARTRKDWGTRQGETNILRHTLYTPQHKADWFLNNVFLFPPSSTEPKSCTLCCGVDWGELDGSIYIHLPSDTYY